MDTTSNKFFSLSQLTTHQNIVVFEQSNVDDLFHHIKNEPKHGPRIVVFDLDSTLKSSTINIETLNIIRKLQADRCQVVGLTAKRNAFVETTIKDFSALNLNLNQGFFKNTRKAYKNRFIADHVFQDGFLFVSGGPTNYKKALKILIKDFQLNHDDIYFVSSCFLSPIQEVRTTCLTFSYNQQALLNRPPAHQHLGREPERLNPDKKTPYQTRFG